jgi:hypothetical protein
MTAMPNCFPPLQSLLVLLFNPRAIHSVVRDYKLIGF